MITDIIKKNIVLQSAVKHAFSLWNTAIHKIRYFPDESQIFYSTMKSIYIVYFDRFSRHFLLHTQIHCSFIHPTETFQYTKFYSWYSLKNFISRRGSLAVFKNQFLSIKTSSHHQALQIRPVLWEDIRWLLQQ